MVVDSNGNETEQTTKGDKTMKPVKIIKSMIRQHKKTNDRISIYSILPYGDHDDWECVQTGYTTWNDNGTSGCGRMPFKTLEEAKAKYPNLPVEA